MAKSRKERQKSHRLSEWERELRLLWSESLSIMLGIMAPPSPGIGEGATQGESAEERSPQPASDAADFASVDSSSFPPYLFNKYLALPPPPLAGQLTICPNSKEWTRSRLYPSFRVSPEVFGAGSVFTWPYRNPEELLGYTEQIIQSELAQMRVHPGGTSRLGAAPLPQVPLTQRCRVALAELVARDVDVARLYGTLWYAGESLLRVLAFYRDLEPHIAALRPRITQDKRSLRSNLLYWKSRLRPADFEALQPKVQELLVLLEMFRRPTEEALRKHRHRLGIYRSGTDRRKQAFWTPLIGWTVKQLEAAHLSEIQTCAVVAQLLHGIWPRIHPYNPAAVKIRYYNSLAVR